MLAGARRHLHPPFALAVDDRHGAMARRRSRELRLAVHRRDPAALDPHFAGDGSKTQYSGGYLLPAADGFFGQAGLGAERRRLSNAHVSRSDKSAPDTQREGF